MPSSIVATVQEEARDSLKPVVRALEHRACMRHAPRVRSSDRGSFPPRLHEMHTSAIECRDGGAEASVRPPRGGQPRGAVCRRPAGRRHARCRRPAPARRAALPLPRSRPRRSRYRVAAANAHMSLTCTAHISVLPGPAGAARNFRREAQQNGRRIATYGKRRSCNSERKPAPNPRNRRSEHRGAQAVEESGGRRLMVVDPIQHSSGG